MVQESIYREALFDKVRIPKVLTMHIPHIRPSIYCAYAYHLSQTLRLLRITSKRQDEDFVRECFGNHRLTGSWFRIWVKMCGVKCLTHRACC